MKFWNERALNVTLPRRFILKFKASGITIRHGSKKAAASLAPFPVKRITRLYDDESLIIIRVNFAFPFVIGKHPFILFRLSECLSPSLPPPPPTAPVSWRLLTRYSLLQCRPVHSYHRSRIVYEESPKCCIVESDKSSHRYGRSLLLSRKCENESEERYIAVSLCFADMAPELRGSIHSIDCDPEVSPRTLGMRDEILVSR